MWLLNNTSKLKRKVRGFQSESELYRPRVRRLSAKLLPILQVRDFVWSAHCISNAVNLSLPDWSRYFFIQGAHRLSSRGSMDSVPDNTSSNTRQLRESNPGPLDLYPGFLTTR
jgi:hypothetical protein